MQTANLSLEDSHAAVGRFQIVEKILRFQRKFSVNDQRTIFLFTLLDPVSFLKCFLNSVVRGQKNAKYEH